MRMPKTPPPWAGIISSLEPTELINVVINPDPPSVKGRYLHWDKLIYLQPPVDTTHEKWWATIKLGRQLQYKYIPLYDKQGNTFKYVLADSINEALHDIDFAAGGKIGIPHEVINPDTRDQYYISSLIEEAITSSQLEGATTTREVAKDMIRTARAPRDRSEQMILNNYRTMQRISKIKHEPLTKDLVFEIHRLVTENAIDKPDAIGRFRYDHENIVVGDDYNRVFHVPPPAAELDDRMRRMCDFANGVTPNQFVHPALRAFVLHFWLAYDHPFCDGNGRTARALFYWAMLHYGFWICEYISISQVIRNAPSKYGRAFLYTETDENDLTHFMVYHVDIFKRALRALDAYVKEKADRLSRVERQMRNVVLLNRRQREVISHALRHPNTLYTIEGHRQSHNIAYQTARTDLINLAERGLLTTKKSGKTWYFIPTSDIETRLAGLA